MLTRLQAKSTTSFMNEHQRPYIQLQSISKLRDNNGPPPASRSNFPKNTSNNTLEKFLLALFLLKTLQRLSQLSATECQDPLGRRARSDLLHISAASSQQCGCNAEEKYRDNIPWLKQTLKPSRRMLVCSTYRVSISNTETTPTLFLKQNRSSLEFFGVRKNFQQTEAQLGCH